jgi:chitin deacetylase
MVSMKEANWEIATHGLKWIDYKDFSRADETVHILEAIRVQEELTGARPLGIYQGRTSAHTLDITMDEQGFLYSADSYADELPYWVEGPHGPHLIVPYTLDANDMRFATPQGFNSGEQFFQYLKDSFDVLYREGEHAPKMMSVGLHCRLVGRPGRAAALERFLDYVQSHDRVWVATRLDIARHWVRAHPPRGGYKPSRMPRALFTEVFGELFEHTPQIAERAHRKGLTPAEDTIDGLFVVLSSTMNAMSEQEKLALVRAHPELAGREAEAGALAADSSTEQARLGFNALTRAEFERIADINKRYREKFGFPCIVALALYKRREDVVAEMERRIAQDPETELAAALAQVTHIAKARLARNWTLSAKA